MADALYRLAPTSNQRIPVEMDHPGKWEAIKILTCVDALDREKSLIQYYPDDFHDPDRAGSPRGVYRLFIDPDRMGGHMIARLCDWTIPVIVHDEVRRTLIRMKADHGLTFTRVD